MCRWHRCSLTVPFRLTISQCSPMDRMVHAAGVPHLRFRDAAHGGKHHSRRNVLFLSEFPDGEKQIVPPVETDAVADKSAGCGHNGMLHR